MTNVPDSAADRDDADQQKFIAAAMMATHAALPNEMTGDDVSRLLACMAALVVGHDHAIMALTCAIDVIENTEPAYLRVDEDGKVLGEERLQ